MKARLINIVVALTLGFAVAACAASKDAESEEESTQEFAENKEKVMAEKEREAQQRREREEAIREQDEQVDAQLEQPEEPAKPRQTIPESQLPEVTECDESGNVTACGIVDGPEGEVRLTASVAPAVMTKGKGQMQMGGVLARLEEQIPSLLACYGWAHLEKSAESTEYDVEIDVKIDGEVQAARVRATDTPVGAAGCMEQRIEGWTMPVPQGGGSTIIATFMFAASK